ncbi:ABC transporter related protein [Rhodomicrobium vannielii ATCC 17100]|uniref:ABC transporter related protein n=1 Tax=Rhodomicrobium vannielii (strain ATCC 17100 / DSM 162 / LMG 4299 / NCIMB 10020 / ATH 3.1.1) TaxID=648757 RepID=E3I466_RHOVT|nr:ABC transporter ATP-binding protein [Rhodomicrobium vannielii]ADP72715.1 ABC transporter related protein [Rhodomicrobium vannielii ATCC 17100]
MKTVTRDFAGTRPVLQLVELERTYVQGNRTLDVLRRASAEICDGEAVALVGPSGSGKSSLLHMAGLLEKPGGGAVLLNGVDCTALNDKDRTRVRRNEIGFVYQSHNLLPEFSALENVMMPQLLAGVRRKDAKERALELLSTFGLYERASHRPAELSGGEQQRVAIARAVANSPCVLLADEPTGNLDPHTADRVFDELVFFIRNSGVAALIATHNFELAGRMDRVLQLNDGVLVEVSRRTAGGEADAERVEQLAK